MRFIALAGSVTVCVLAAIAAVAVGGVGFIVVAVIFGALARCSGFTTWSSVATRSCATTRSSGTPGSPWRQIRPELQQYFIERNYDGRPFDRDTRTSIYERAKGVKDEQAYGTERDVREPGYEWLLQSIHSFDPPKEVAAGDRSAGPDCSRPYEMALLNVSAMSFGALSGRGADGAQPRARPRAASPTTPGRAA